MKYVTLFVLSALVHDATSQGAPPNATTSSRSLLTVAYEGGQITHPGVSIGYATRVLGKALCWLELGAKAGFYYHRRYQTGVFVQPAIRVLIQNRTGWFCGAELNVGPQRVFIPNVYTFDNRGVLMQNKGVGMVHWVIAPGIRFGGDVFESRNLPIQWLVNPQLQFRNQKKSDHLEKYFLLGVGINYKL